MNNKTNSRNRFPGAKPFTAEDKEVFYGREKDIQRLYELLCLKKLMVLYAKSGIGKSSLVNAGLIPRFENLNETFEFLAIKIRFGLSQDEGVKSAIQPGALVARIFEELEVHKKRLKITELPFIAKTSYDSLWYQVKLFERNNICLLLVFDQFEEAFTYDNDALVFFKEQLFSLFSCIPVGLNTIINDKIKHIEREVEDPKELYQIDKDLEFLDSPLKTKILLVIREANFGLFNLFHDYFPDILKDSYKLSPLNRLSAQDAIILPAKNNGDFKTPPFCFSTIAIKELLDKIAEKNDTFDPFTIQLTCRYIERTLVEQSGRTEIRETDIPEVGVIVNDFINSIWKTLPRVLKRKTGFYKEIIEEKLIAHDIERRISVHESNWLEDEVVTILINEGLLKRDRRGGVDYIELSHDRLIAPLLKDYDARRQHKAANRIKFFISLLIISMSMAFISLVRLQSNENEILEESLNIQLLKDSIQEKSDSSSFTSTEKRLNSLFIKKYHKILFKIDIFYVDSAYEKEINNGVPFQRLYAETVAAELAEVLEKQTNYVVRKKLIPVEMRKNSNYQSRANIIKYEFDDDRDEDEAANNIIKSIRSALQVQLTPSIVKTTRETHNYISIFLKNSL